MAFLGATWTLSRLDLQPSKFEILQVPHCQRDPTGDHGEHEEESPISEFRLSRSKSRSPKLRFYRRYLVV